MAVNLNTVVPLRERVKSKISDRSCRPVPAVNRPLIDRRHEASGLMRIFVKKSAIPFNKKIYIFSLYFNLKGKFFIFYYFLLT